MRAGERPLEFRVIRKSNGTIYARATWRNNYQALRKAMQEGKPIRDISQNDKGGKYLNAERLALEERGWTRQVINGETYYVPPGG